MLSNLFNMLNCLLCDIRNNKGNYKSHISLKFKYMAEKNLENYLKHSKK